MGKTNEKASLAEKKALTVYGEEFVYLAALGICLSFVGWATENAARAVMAGVIDSRFHILPFIAPYSLIAFAYHILFKDPDDAAFFGRKIFRKKTFKNKLFSNVLCYVLTCAFVFLGELAVGNGFEKLFGVKLWNYEGQKFHFTRYTSLLSTFGFGTGAYLFFAFGYIPCLRAVERLGHKRAKIITLTLGTLILLDNIVLIIYICITHTAPVYWSISIR